MEQASELQWLRYFFSHADFGPADDDVRYIIEEDFTRTTGLALPKGYERSND